MTTQAPRTTILLLAIAQSLYSCAVITVFATGPLVGLMLAPSQGLATWPVTSFVVGSMIAVYPASYFMKIYGRKPIFIAGAFSSIIGALISVWAIYHSNFYLFCAGAVLQGVLHGDKMEVIGKRMDCLTTPRKT